ncbi:alpha-galactosidase [Gracilinema caldarium]|uniref:Alpha-galactosidase n=1 Tax=Gracilinema caldarium (strain ATCC 51460 / DSM 7334 / H1) TaxID=744872 RepID=F8EZV2_GRAC1|nr:alpha-galactosidase [Gracilinema caldarium]AEJ18465.1 Alpha-galactosidase [Gracilinema caldarium DSM 7334]
MAIVWHPDTREFHLQNSYVSYIISLLPDNSPGLAYFGRPLDLEGRYSRLVRFEDRGLTTHQSGLPSSFCLDYVPREYPTYGRGDYRIPAITLETEHGFPVILDLQYREHWIVQGKPSVPGLPATYCDSDAEAESLMLTLEDPSYQVQVDVHYTIFRDYPVIARRASIRNGGVQALRILRAYSAVLDLDSSDWDFIHFSGAWARERHVVRRPLAPGLQSIASSRGSSSAQHNPAIMLARREATETAGEVLGALLVYSGNHSIEVEVGSHGDTRIALGINPFGFKWNLSPGDVLETPEALFCYTDHGFGDLSLSMHQLLGRHLVRGWWRDRERPILINNWEATYFQFDEQKLLDIARSAKDLGIELFVLDDGWFGKRNDDRSSLGDWEVNRDKLPQGIEGLACKIVDMGLSFGLWIEPEMVNPDSNLYRQHPDWAVGSILERRTLGRNQLVLDMSRLEVVEYLYDTLSQLLSQVPISYIKWDMNRHITEPVSAALPADRQGEFFHRYMLGVYELYRRLTEAFPRVLFESCSAGGNRFDAGMLAFAPQAWASDDSDAIERLAIQWGTSFFYPPSAIGAHVSAVPNHQVGRITPLWTRAGVAFFGAFGYELDPNKLSESDKAEIRAQVDFYKAWRRVFQFGRFYRLAGFCAAGGATGGMTGGPAGTGQGWPGSRPAGNSNLVAWMSVSEDSRRAVVLIVQVLARPNPGFYRIPLRGLDPDLSYQVRCRPALPVKDEAAIRYNEGLRQGDELINVGLLLGGDGWNGLSRGDFASWLFTLEG